MLLVTRRTATRLVATGLAATGATLTMGGLPRLARAAGETLAEARPRPLPDGLGWTDGDGVPSGPQAFIGRGMVINLWATWCAPCVAEMPALDRLAMLLARDGTVVLPLSSDRGGRAQVAPFYERTGLRTLGIWLDPRGAAGRALGVRGLPTTIIVDRAGMERARLEGAANWDTPRMVAAIRRLVGPLPASGAAT